MQNEITKMTKLLNEDGNIIEPGYARNMLYEYNRENIKAGVLRKKEWDFYQVIIGDWVLKLTIGNISYVAQFAAELFNVVTKELYSFERMRLLPFEKLQLPLDPENPSILNVEGKDYKMSFDVMDNERHLVIQGKDKKIGRVDIDIRLNNDTDNEKIVIATPFEKNGHFYLNCKENFYGGSGKICFGDVCVEVDESATAVLDWGRGVWPFSQEWYWGNGAGYIGGRKFGFNIGWGFGDLKSASENMFFVDGKGYKLGHLTTSVDINNYFKPWEFKDEDGRLDMVMTPVYDKIADTKIGPIQMYCHQLFGYYNGYVVMPDGEKLVVENMLAFCEHAKNRW